MLEIVIYSISENDLVMDTVVSMANYLSAGGLSVAVREDEKKKGLSYRNIKGCNKSGVFRLNGVNYYAKDSECVTKETQVLIWDAGTTNVLYEMKENANAYMCVDAEFEDPGDVANYFEEIGTKTDVLLYHCDKATLQDFKSEGIKCIQTEMPVDGVCSHEICERLKNAVVLKGLPLPKTSHRTFEPLDLSTADIADDKETVKKKKESIFSFGKKKAKPEKDEKRPKTKKSKAEYDGNIDEDEEEFNWTENVYVKPFLEEQIHKKEIDEIENIIVDEKEIEKNGSGYSASNIKCTHEAFMPNDIPMPEAPPMYKEEIINRPGIEKHPFENAPEPSNSSQGLNAGATHKNAAQQEKIERVEQDVKEEGCEKQRCIYVEDDLCQEDSEDTEEENTLYERSQPPRTSRTGIGALNGVLSFLESRMGNDEHMDSGKKETVKFMGRMSICLLDLYSGCGASYLCGSIASIMSGSYGKKTYIVRKKTAVTPDNGKIREVTEKEQMKQIERNAVIIYDGGIYDRSNEGQEAMIENCDIKALVCPGTEDSMSLLARHIHANKDTAKDWIYIFNNMSNKKQEKKVRELMHAYDVLFVPAHDFSKPPKNMVVQWKQKLRKILSGI